MNFIKNIASLLLASIIGAGTTVAQTSFEVEQKMYLDCIELRFEDPDLSYTNGLTWLETGGGLPAHHCVALSLVEMGRYLEAARTLEVMADDMERGFGWPFANKAHPRDYGMLAAIYGQTGNAWLLAGEVKKAITVFTIALREVDLNTPENAELLIDRARAQASLGRYDEALRDLSLAEIMIPETADIHALKANAYRSLMQYDLAEELLKKAFYLDPDHREAMLERGNLKMDLGDGDGARKDWMAYLLLYPEGEGADSIRRNLEILDVRVEDFDPED